MASTISHTAGVCFNYKTYLMYTNDTERALRHELANSLTHGFGILFGIVSIPLLITTATQSGNVAAIVGSSVYGFCFLMLYTFSTLYHGFQQPMVKRALMIMDHISIYFLIAGSYTPFILLFLYNTTGLTMLAILWSLTLLGIVFKVLFADRYNFLSTAIYVLMGWMLVAVARSFFANIPAEVATLIVVGGCLYSVGVVFYLWTKLTHHHVVWHLFVLAASICHYAAVLLSVS